MNINSFDFNLLRVFNALMQERNVTKAAEKIGLAQSSMSNALSRLRYAFDDELFVRTPNGMMPTQRAKVLEAHVNLALGQIQTMIDVVVPFDPTKASGTVNIATSDNVKVLLAPLLSRFLQDKAPGLNVQFNNIDKSTVFQQLDGKETDIAIGTFSELPKRFAQQTLYEDTFVCLARKGHPGLKKGMNLRRFADIPHILMSLNKDRKGFIDNLLAEKGLKRRVAITVDQFSVLPKIVEATDYLAICPQSVAETMCMGTKCQIYPLPFDAGKWQVSLVWLSGIPDQITGWTKEAILKCLKDR